MKNIFKYVMLVSCCVVYAVPAYSDSKYGGIFGTSDYLIGAADAWVEIFAHFGTSGDIASYVQGIQSSNITKFAETISILGFNSTAMALYETNSHIDQSFSVISMPLVGRRDGCVAGRLNCDGERKLIIDGQFFGSFADYRSDANSEFNTRNTGVSINAKMFITDGLLFGAAYTRTMTDTHDNRVYTDATGNSITLFGEYLAESGLFMNAGLNAGHTSWAADKSISGIADNSVYDTDFFAGQFNAGIRVMRGRISMVPQLGVRYTRVMTDRYIDAAAQEFGDWWYNTMSAMAGFDIGYDFIGTDFIIRPAMHFGGGYDVISNGTDAIDVQLINKQFYYIPIDAPSRTAFNGAVGVMFFSRYFNAGVNYRLDMRSGYTAHTISAMLKIGF